MDSVPRLLTPNACPTPLWTFCNHIILDQITPRHPRRISEAGFFFLAGCSSRCQNQSCQRKRPTRIVMSTYLYNTSQPAGKFTSEQYNCKFALLIGRSRLETLLHHQVVEVDGSTLFVSMGRDIDDTTRWISSSQHVHQQMSQQEVT